MSRRARALALFTPFAVVSLAALPGAHAATHTVLTRSTNTFDPAALAIAIGDQVTWGNPANGTGGVNHTVTATSDNWEFDESLALPGATASFTFERSGTYTYVCETHGPTMRGTVVVRAASTPRPTPRPTPPPTPRPSPSPTRTTRPTPTPTPSASETASLPPVSGSPGVPGSPPANPSPSVAPAERDPSPSESPLTYTGRGVTPSPATNREWGLPVMLAVLSIVGVAAAEARTIRATSGDGETL